MKLYVQDFLDAAIDILSPAKYGLKKELTPEMKTSYIMQLQKLHSAIDTMHNAIADKQNEFSRQKKEGEAKTQ